MTEQDVRRGVSALRFTVRNPPRALDDLADFFSGLDTMHGFAVVLRGLESWAEQGHPVTDEDVDRYFQQLTFFGHPSVENLNMRSPLEFWLTTATEAGTYALASFYLLLRAPEKLARLPTIHAQWHEGRLKKEILKAQRNEFQRRLAAGDIDVLALGFDPNARQEEE